MSCSSTSNCEGEKAKEDNQCELTSRLWETEEEEKRDKVNGALNCSSIGKPNPSGQVTSPPSRTSFDRKTKWPVVGFPYFFFLLLERGVSSVETNRYLYSLIFDFLNMWLLDWLAPFTRPYNNAESVILFTCSMGLKVKCCHHLAEVPSGYLWHHRGQLPTAWHSWWRKADRLHDFQT